MGSPSGRDTRRAFASRAEARKPARKNKTRSPWSDDHSLKMYEQPHSTCPAPTPISSQNQRIFAPDSRRRNCEEMCKDHLRHRHDRQLPSPVAVTKDPRKKLRRNKSMGGAFDVPGPRWTRFQRESMSSYHTSRDAPRSRERSMPASATRIHIHKYPSQSPLVMAGAQSRVVPGNDGAGVSARKQSRGDGWCETAGID